MISRIAIQLAYKLKVSTSRGDFASSALSRQAFFDDASSLQELLFVPHINNDVE